MNSIRQTQALNKRELENAIQPSASWHADYRDTAWIYVGGFPFDVSEGDIATIFSQFGNPTHLNLIRDKDTGKSKGFGFLKYEDQRSCDLAVDNLGGADVLGRLLRVDHTRYKKRDDEDEETHRIDKHDMEADQDRKGGSDMTDSETSRQKRERSRSMLKEEKEFQDLLSIKDGEEEDPMRQYLIREKREEVEQAKAREDRQHRRHKHHHRHLDDRKERRNSDRRSHRHRERRGSGGRERRTRSASSSDNTYHAGKRSSKDSHPHRRKYADER